MSPETWIIEERERRERRPWEPEPLHAPMPLPYWPTEPVPDREDSSEGDAGTVIIIDMGDFSERAE